MLPAQALAANPDISVTFVGVTRRYQQCQEGVQAQANAASAIQYSPLLVCQEVSVWQCRKAGKEESEFLQPTRRQHWLLWR